MKIAPLILAAAVMTPPALAAQAGQAARAQATPSAKQAASSLARILAPREIMIPLNMKWAERGIEQMPKLSAESAEFESQFPGVHRAMWLGAKDELTAQLEVSLPHLWARLEQLYLAELTEPEIRALVAFYGTPTGRRLIERMFGNADLQPMIQSVATSEDGTISTESARIVTENAKRKALAEADVDPQDVLPLMAAMPLSKLKSLGESVQRVTMEWVNEDNPEQQERINKLMTEAATRFVKSSKSSGK